MPDASGIGWLYRKGCVAVRIPILAHTAQPDIPATSPKKVAAFLAAVKNGVETYHGVEVELDKESIGARTIRLSVSAYSILQE